MDFLNTPEKLDRRMTHVPMGRFGEAVEQAKAVVFRMSLPSRPPQAYELNSAVASDDSSFINGTDFMVDGGLHACYVVSSYQKQDPGRGS
jgi:NAD(P)-dependent dehydrogenase (short-subunit alcohol dehydrogenase family)